MRQMAKVAITVDAETLRRVDASARRKKVSRSRYVTEALRAALRSEMAAEVRGRIAAIMPAIRREQSETAERFLAASGVREEEDTW